MPARIASIVSDLGMDWDEGLSIPVANVENKFLEEEIQNKLKLMTKLSGNLASDDDRVNSLSLHLKNVRHELSSTLGLLRARDNEIESEDHQRKIAEREDGRLGQELHKLDKEWEVVKENRNIHENTIFKQTQRLEDMKSQMNWDQQALEAWLEESARKDEDAMILAKYTRMDEAKVKELTLKIEHLTEDSAKKRHQLDNETTETLTAQIELDKTAEEFRKAHAERRDLIQQWEHTIEQMQRRDNEMDELAVQLSHLKDDIRQRDVTIKDKQKFLDSESQNNTEIEKRITMADRLAARIRIDFQEAETQRDQYHSELDALKRTVDRTAMELENCRSTVNTLRKAAAEKMLKLQNAKQQNERLRDELKIVTESELSAEERAARIEELLTEEEAFQHDIDAELTRLRGMQYCKVQELHNARKGEKDTEAMIQSGRAAMRNINCKLYKLDHDSLKQQEIVYNQDLAIQQLERSISRMQGEQSNDEKMVLKDKIKALMGLLEQRIEKCALLSMQRKRLQDDVRHMHRDLERTKAAKGVLSDKIEQLHQHNNISENVLKRNINDKHNLMVDANLLKLELHRLRQQLNSKADVVLTLEKRRLQIDTAMKERRREINVHREMLLGQMKGAEMERQQITLELHERITKIEMLRKRYEIQMVSMAPPIGEEDRSQAFYVIKAAQDKEALQREGDDLDSKIKKAEREILALENTLNLMNNRNETYRKSFNKVGNTSVEMESKEQLEEQLRAVMDKYKYKRRLIRELQEDLQTMSQTLDRLSQDDSAYSELLEERQRRVVGLQGELSEQEVKLERSAKVCAKLQREVRAAVNAKEELPEERDFSVRELRELNKNAMKSVGAAVQQYPDIGQSVHLYFLQAELPPPPIPAPGTRSHATRPTSSRSSATSRSSRNSGDSALSGVLSPTGSKQAVSMGAVDFALSGSPASSSRSSASSNRSQKSGRR